MQMVLVDYPRMQKPALWMGMPHRSTGLREDLSLLGSATASPDLSNYSGIYINLSTCKLFFLFLQNRPIYSGYCVSNDLHFESKNCSLHLQRNIVH